MNERETPNTNVGHADERGFTLIELMITVAIIAVLAILAGVGYVRWIRTSKTGEATATIAAIKGAEETYRAEKFIYLDASNCGTCTTLGSANYHPRGTPTDQKVAWATWLTAACTAGSVACNFQRLNINADTNVYYSYGIAAGSADGAAHTMDGRAQGTANDPWYVVKAAGDLNNNGTLSSYWSSSWDSTVTSTNPDE